MWNLDAWLYASSMAFIFMQGYLSSDEAYKYANPYALFWVKFIVGSIAAATGGLKAFRSTTYARLMGMTNPPDNPKVDKSPQMSKDSVQPPNADNQPKT